MGDAAPGVPSEPPNPVKMPAPTECMASMTRTAITINGRRVGPGHAVFVIAEAGSNHNGRREMALELIDAARQLGANWLARLMAPELIAAGPNAANGAIRVSGAGTTRAGAAEAAARGSTT